MKKIFSVLVLIALVGCSKTVNRGGSSFAITEDPNPTPIPTTSPGPSPTPSSTPSPVPTPVTCDPSKLGNLPEYAVFVRGDLKLNCVTVGRRVAATDACVQGGTIGKAMSSNSARADLSAGMTLAVRGVKVPNGKITYGKSMSKRGSTALGGFAKEAFDLEPQFRAILDFSKVCGKAVANTKILRTCKAGPAVPNGSATKPEVCTVTIYGESAVNIAVLTPAETKNVFTYVIDVPKGTSLVTNLPEHQSVTFGAVTVSFSARAGENPSSGQVYWNFPAADRMAFAATKFRGTVVAPDAGVKVAGQKGEAGFWVRDLAGTNSNW